MTDDERKTGDSLRAEITSLKATVRELETKLARTSPSGSGDAPLQRDGFDPLLEFAPFAVERLSDEVYLITKDGRIGYVNDAACDSLGYHRNELIGMSMLSINPTLTQEIWDAVWVITARDKHQAIETLHRTKDGRIVPVEILANHLELHGQEYSCAFARDISDRKAAESKLRREHEFVTSVIDTAPVIVLILDSAGHIDRFNKYTEEITGYSLEEVQGKDWISIFVPTNLRQKVQRRFEEAMNGVDVAGVVNPIVTKPGDIRDIIWYDKPLTDDDHQVLGLLAIGQDITERHKMELRIRQSEKMEAIGQLAGGIAHDFNNQLAGIVGYADLLKLMPGTTSHVHQFADAILQAAARASDLTEQLLAFSRKGKYLSIPVDLNDIVQEVVRMLERSVDKKISIQTRLEAKRTLTIGDPSQIQNAVLNLAINARDAMPEGGVMLFSTAITTLDSDYCDKSPYLVTPGKYVQVTVADTGMGMDEKTRTRIFEPFFTTKAPGKGTGMGLAAVYGTVKNHKGAIQVCSNEGTGTQVTVYLQQTTEQTGLKRSHDSDAPPCIATRVLLVDDEEIVRTTTAGMLQQLGCRVRTAQNGREAVESYRKSHQETDVVILDLVMPQMSGKETFWALREINSQVAVILASGYSLDGEVQGILEEGAGDFIHKPFRIGDLARKISDIMHEEREDEGPEAADHPSAEPPVDPTDGATDVRTSIKP